MGDGRWDGEFAEGEKPNVQAVDARALLFLGSSGTVFWRREFSRCCPTTPLNKLSLDRAPLLPERVRARIPSVDESQADF